jgi:tRNA threonylcarbamoyladenosine biosynthesis protein TsaE
MGLSKTIILQSEDDTRKLAQEFASILKNGDCVVLNGELGVGKTFFVKRLVECFGIERSSSPSFALVNVYEGEKIINHFDFYRIKSNEELFDIGYNEYIGDTESITLIEWGNLFPDVLPVKRLDLNFSFNPDMSRTVEILG